jgi:CheY-like chemotaxis protein
MSGERRELHGLRILVVDDCEDEVIALATLLEMSGAEVRRCGSAADARSELGRRQADLIISDLMMPGEDGFDLIMSIRCLAADQGGATPAIAFSNDRLSRARALECGFQEFVPKVEIDELFQAITSLTPRGPSH